MEAAGARDRVRAELMDAIAQGKQFEAVARRKGARQTDRHGIVTVTANGFGDVVDLAISDQAQRHPQQLGDLVTDAVAKARRAGRTVGDRLRERQFPAVPPSEDLTSAMLEAPDGTRYDQSDYADSPEVKNAIAECGEFLQKLADETREFERKSLRCEIGTGAGYVETNLADTLMRIRISPEAPGNVGLARLTQQILTAIKRASELARIARASTLKESLAGSKIWRTTGDER